MIRRILPLALALLLLLPMAASAGAQTSGSPNITLTTQWILTPAGAVVLNETLTFSNNGTSSVQIPSVQLGLPDSMANHTTGFVVSSNDPYSQTSSNSKNVTTFTISTSSPTLAAGASSSVSLKGYLTGQLNITAGAAGNLSALVLLSPSLSQNVTTLNQDIVLPSEGVIKPQPTGFIIAPTGNEQIYAATVSNVKPAISTSSVIFSDSDEAVWQPVQVYSVIRTIVPGSNGVPQVDDTVSLRNLASYAITELPISLLAPGLTNVTILPSSAVPTINPTPVGLTDGDLNIADAPFVGQIAAGDNFTFAMRYPLPKADLQTSGNTVTVTIPYSLPIATIAANYTVGIALPSGMHASGQTKVAVTNATSILQGNVQLKYSISPGWGAVQAIPAAVLIFAACFITLTFTGAEQITKKKEEEEENEVLGDSLADLIKTLENKISLFQQFQDNAVKKPQGAVTRSDLNKIKNELDALKVTAMNRLSSVRQLAQSQRYIDLLNQLQEAEREEDRAAKDLINLFDQYQSRRMREETFHRLYPNYKKRLDAATNHLSDLLNLAQREGKQA